MSADPFATLYPAGYITKSQLHLWEEEKHPRAESGQFSSVDAVNASLDDDDGSFDSGGDQDMDDLIDDEDDDDDDEPVKIRALRGPMTAARREGRGKDDDRVILEDGTIAPDHIKPSMISPVWTEVKVSLDPDADVFVTGRAPNGRAKTVYSQSFRAKTSAAKFLRTQEGSQWMPVMTAQVHKGRQNEGTRNEADVVWLMMEQGTRPGSETDTKGVKGLFGEPMSPQNIHGDIKSMGIKIGDELVPVRDKGTRKEILRRLESGEHLGDSTYWLKSHGATTLEGRHVIEAEDGVRLRFVGKEGVWHDHLIKNPSLANMLLGRKEAAGESGKIFGTSYDRAKAYTKTLDKGKFTPKDLRTIKATEMASALIRADPSRPANEKEYKARVEAVARKVSSVLGNRPAQALLSYIDPNVFTVWRV